MSETPIVKRLAPVDHAAARGALKKQNRRRLISYSHFQGG